MAQSFTGTVTSIKMNKTIVIRVVSRMRHRIYKKVVTTHRTYKAHNEIADLKLGDVVEITETRPISKTVHFNVTKKI
ncbi:MAG: 30S ribosomal protein S17 [Microgenomates group bacterium]|jgi:small subunit ribosomal protein S17|nr:30S ribosomal protein S17 [Candidatus Woesebacteria bacterium]MBP6882858.1 30S ribosomal protein S17 [Candidatus Woesebacteria bacterium]QQR63560.1 MAG: 30S ribosomal protein S17 [Candidatus Roizmanbacteria bacterium]